MMNIHPIKSEKDYEEALDEVEALWVRKKVLKKVINWMY